ncbi:hypothetical protein A3Q56_01649 [Intoshia linei]|uniref:polyribonucleotide nucleotidyltransferase n=1 Tax=Intoshia linei TaxID=1819745 RepID=A0A177BAJ9_9BILA|nr:hypothetical protein A3Q56_01649 [Intoshia linei]
MILKWSLKIIHIKNVICGNQIIRDFGNLILHKHIEKKWKLSQTLYSYNSNRTACSFPEFSTGKFARVATSSILATKGNSSVLSVCVIDDEPRDLNLNLNVNYKQNMSAASRIPTNFFRRDLGNSQTEILTSRLIDRSLRSGLSSIQKGINITANLMSIDAESDPDILSINSASLAIQKTGLNFDPVAACRVCIIDDKVEINPLAHEAALSTVNLVVVSNNAQKIVMIEGDGEEIDNDNILVCLTSAIEKNDELLNIMKKFISNHTKHCINNENTWIDADISSDEGTFLEDNISAAITELFNKKIKHRNDFHVNIMNIRKNIKKLFFQTFPDSKKSIDSFMDNSIRQKCRNLIITHKRRFDDRQLSEIREIYSEIDIFPLVHASALFQRGYTQVYTSLTFDSPQSSVKIDPINALLTGKSENKFFHHYEFPSFAVNESSSNKKMRREVGHGMLAEKSIRSILPREDLEFTIRLNSQVLESNGSSSMASVCASSLALFSAGVNIKRHVAGVAVGCIMDENETVYLTDITGFEDYIGDMDFKIAGTSEGVTGIQLDLKTNGLTIDQISKSLDISLYARLKIIENLKSTININRNVKNKDFVNNINFPIIESRKIEIEKRAQLIGVGGLNLRKIINKTGVTISTVDENHIEIFAPNKNSFDTATKMIDELLSAQREPTLEFGRVYEAEVAEIRSSGLMVKLYESMIPVLVPNSQLDSIRISHPEVLGFTPGDTIKVKYFGRDSVNGRMRLSRKMIHSLGKNQTAINFINRKK